VTGIQIAIPFPTPQKKRGVSLRELASLQELVYSGYLRHNNVRRYKVFLDIPESVRPLGMIEDTISIFEILPPLCEYQNQPNDENAGILHDYITTGYFNFSSSKNIILETIYYPRLKTCNLNGELVPLILDCRHEFLKAAMAQSLWDEYSEEYAQQIIELTGKLSGDSNDVIDLKENVAADLKPERILKELQKKDNEHLAWWVWLAVLRPHVSFKPVILELAETEYPLPETVYALWQSRDPRALPVMLTILKNKQNLDDCLCCIAAEAIGDLGDASVEPQLLDALQGNPSKNPKAKICEALGKIGTKKSLPALQKIATAEEYQSIRCGPDEFPISEKAKTAIAAIERRAAEKTGNAREEKKRE
jgi:hypothetical protein